MTPTEFSHDPEKFPTFEHLAKYFNINPHRKAFFGRVEVPSFLEQTTTVGGQIKLCWNAHH